MESTFPNARVLLVEDDERLSDLTARYLERHGFQVITCTNGRDALSEALKGLYDVVVLDIMLPRMSGTEVCKALRARSEIPILMLTALGEESDKVLGLEMGADDYLAKPFSSRELVARIRALIRRARTAVSTTSSVLRVGRLELSPRDYAATLDGRPLRLTTAEFTLLRAFAEHPGRVLTREQLLDLTKGSADEVFDRSIDAHISRIRHKLREDPRHPRLLKTVRGAGYMLATGEVEPEP